jgi:hypothetical protein
MCFKEATQKRRGHGLPAGGGGSSYSKAQRGSNCHPAHVAAPVVVSSKAAPPAPAAGRRRAVLRYTPLWAAIPVRVRLRGRVLHAAPVSQYLGIGCQLAASPNSDVDEPRLRSSFCETESRECSAICRSSVFGGRGLRREGQGRRETKEPSSSF